MKKIVLVKTEEGKHCDIFPGNSLHQVEHENQGTYKVPWQNNNYLNFDWVEDHNYEGDFDRTHMCFNCKNVFIPQVVLVDNKCPRCIDRKIR